MAPGPLRDWCSSSLAISGTSGNSPSLMPSHPFSSLLPPGPYMALGFFSFPSPGLNHSTSLEGKPRRARPALEGNLEAIYHFRFPLIKSFLSVTKTQLMVSCYPVHSLALFSAALGKKLSQLPMLINHANYDPSCLTQASSDTDCLSRPSRSLGSLCSSCPSARLAEGPGRSHFPGNKCSPKIMTIDR